MQHPSLSGADAGLTDRRHIARYPCIARVHTDARRGVTADMGSGGLSFHTMDTFDVDEILDLCVNFEIAQESAIQVVHAAKVVWIAIASSGRAWQVGVEFLH
jgi:PilZ domain